MSVLKNEFSDDKIKEIKNAIDRALDSSDHAKIAAFDADGTLWDTDLGENFFNYQIKNKLLNDLPENAWDYYHSMQSKDAPAAFLWLAQINQGLPISTVREWASLALTDLAPLPVFTWAKSIISYLLSQSVDVYIVTASVTWAVEPGARLLGVPIENVVGVQTAVNNGIITAEPDGPITWREGKVSALLQRTKNQSPFFSAGNTMGDLALLEAASHVRVVNCAAPDGDRNFATEKKLLEIAKSKNWFYHQY